MHSNYILNYELHITSKSDLIESKPLILKSSNALELLS